MILEVKSEFLDLKNYGLAAKTRKAKWCKMQVNFLKLDRNGNVKD